MKNEMLNRALDEFQTNVNDILHDHERELLGALVEEYKLRNPLDNEDTIAGRHAAVRGMAVRIGLYGEFERSLK